MTIEQAFGKLKQSKPPPTEIEKYQYLQQIWMQEQMSSFKDFLRWYNDKDVLATLEAMQKLIAFYHDKNIDTLKLYCNLPNRCNICLQKSTDAKFYAFTEGDKNLLEKIRGDVAGGPSIVFTHKAVVDESFFFESLQTFASLSLGLTPAHYIPLRCVNPCLPVILRVGISIQKRVDSHLDKTRPAALRIRSFAISNEQDQNVKLKASLQQADRRKLTASVLIGFVLNATLCLKQWCAFTAFAAVKSCVHLSLKMIFNVVRRRESSMH